MAKFHNQVHSEDIGYFEGRLVRRIIDEPLIWFHEDKRIEHPVGFESDGASVPRIPFIYDIWGDKIHREAFPHDFGYRKDSFVMIVDPEINRMITGPIPERYILDKRPISKEDDDWWLRQTILEHVSPTYSWGTYQPIYWAVRCCGGSSFHRMNVADHFKLDE
jgi:hypothetical protein